MGLGIFSFSNNSTSFTSSSFSKLFFLPPHNHLQTRASISSAAVSQPEPPTQIAGNCRMCLVEVEKSPKPVASVPCLHFLDINEEWISDKTRFSYDDLKRRRLNDPMIRDSEGRFKAVSWRDALEVVGDIIHRVKPDEIVGIAGQLSDA